MQMEWEALFLDFYNIFFLQSKKVVMDQGSDYNNQLFFGTKQFLKKSKLCWRIFIEL